MTDDRQGLPVPSPPPTSAKFVHCKTGDGVVLRWGTKKVDAVVLLASGNGRSLVVGFDGMLDGWAGGCSLGWFDADECFVTVGGNSTLVTVAKKEDLAARDAREAR